MSLEEVHADTSQAPCVLGFALPSPYAGTKTLVARLSRASEAMKKPKAPRAAVGLASGQRGWGREGTLSNHTAPGQGSAKAWGEGGEGRGLGGLVRSFNAALMAWGDSEVF